MCFRAWEMSLVVLNTVLCLPIGQVLRSWRVTVEQQSYTPLWPAVPAPQNVCRSVPESTLVSIRVSQYLRTYHPNPSEINRNRYNWCWYKWWWEIGFSLWQSIWRRHRENLSKNVQVLWSHTLGCNVWTLNSCIKLDCELKPYTRWLHFSNHNVDKEVSSIMKQSFLCSSDPSLP